MSRFTPGLELSRNYYRQVLGPLIALHFSSLRYAAALVGPGSDVLGFDTEVSIDHDWGPRLLLFLGEADVVGFSEEIARMLRRSLPASFLGFPTSFTDAGADGTRQMTLHVDGERRHGIEIETVSSFVAQRLGAGSVEGPSHEDWLGFSEQALLEITAGDVFVDMTGELSAARRRLAYYPQDVWLYHMASHWARLAEIEPFVGRAGDAGDDLGSRLVAASIVRELMLLSFNIERVYAPYEKWLGTAFLKLCVAAELQPYMERSMTAGSWLEREDALCMAYRSVARAHNKLGVTPTLDVEPRPFYSRRYRVIAGRRFADALAERIEDPGLRERFMRQSWI